MNVAPLQSQSSLAVEIIVRKSARAIKINVGNGKRELAIKMNVHVILNTAFTLIAHTKSSPLGMCRIYCWMMAIKGKFTTLFCCERPFGSGNGLNFLRLWVALMMANDSKEVQGTFPLPLVAFTINSDGLISLKFSATLALARFHFEFLRWTRARCLCKWGLSAFKITFKVTARESSWKQRETKEWGLELLTAMTIMALHSMPLL